VYESIYIMLFHVVCCHMKKLKEILVFFTGETVVFELQCVLHSDNASVHAERFRQDAD